MIVQVEVVENYNICDMQCLKLTSIFFLECVGGPRIIALSRGNVEESLQSRTSPGYVPTQ